MSTFATTASSLERQSLEKPSIRAPTIFKYIIEISDLKYGPKLPPYITYRNKFKMD